MDIKSKAQILKKRSKELGYDIKLTHAQEIVSALYGHQSRHSALLEDKKRPQLPDIEHEKSEQLKVDNYVNSLKEEGFEFYFGSDKLPEDDYQLSEKAFNVGLKIGYKHGREMSDKLDKIVEEASSQHENIIRSRIFNRSVYFGILRALTTKLDIDPLRDYFKELENGEKPSRIGGMDVIQKLLKNKTKEMWLKIRGHISS